MAHNGTRQVWVHHMRRGEGTHVHVRRREPIASSEDRFPLRPTKRMNIPSPSIVYCNLVEASDFRKIKYQGGRRKNEQLINLLDYISIFYIPFSIYLSLNWNTTEFTKRIIKYCTPQSFFCWCDRRIIPVPPAVSPGFAGSSSIFILATAPIGSLLAAGQSPTDISCESLLHYTRHGMMLLIVEPPSPLCSLKQHRSAQYFGVLDQGRHEHCHCRHY